MAKKKKQTPRCTAVEHNRRVLKVADMLCDGFSIREIGRDEAIKAWGVDMQQLQRYIKQAWKDIGAFQEQETKEKITKAIAERDRLKLRCTAKKDYQTALRAMDSRDKIAGILKDTKEPSMVLSVDASTLSPEMKDRLDKEMKAIFGKAGK